jgi:hypothetical protein
MQIACKREYSYNAREELMHHVCMYTLWYLKGREHIQGSITLEPQIPYASDPKGKERHTIENSHLFYARVVMLFLAKEYHQNNTQQGPMF